MIKFYILKKKSYLFKQFDTIVNTANIMTYMSTAEWTDKRTKGVLELVFYLIVGYLIFMQLYTYTL